eukprot:5942042-Amphidinium_carterae.1
MSSAEPNLNDFGMGLSQRTYNYLLGNGKSHILGKPIGRSDALLKNEGAFVWVCCLGAIWGNSHALVQSLSGTMLPTWGGDRNCCSQCKGFDGNFCGHPSNVKP